MQGFYDHPTKKVIREQWCKPMIKHLSEKLGYRLTYLGLPGIDAIDIKTWIEYLNKVIAFDIGDYSEPYDNEIAKRNILKLTKILNELETKGQLDTYSLYHGYIEEVVLKGMDRNRLSFNQNSFVTIYNLDFCNSLTVPLKLTDPNTGNVNTFYKAEVIRKLLERQLEIAKENNGGKFIFYITVHSQFWQNEAEKLFVGGNANLYKQYLSTIDKLDERDRNIRLLRLYFIDFMSTHFCSNQFIPEFLPTLFYNGTGDNWLLCFTIIGTYIKNAACKAPFYQLIDTLINEKFLIPNETTITHLKQNTLREKNCILDSVNAIRELKSYKELWLQ